MSSAQKNPPITLDLCADTRQTALTTFQAKYFLFDLQILRHLIRLSSHLFLLYSLTVRGIRGRYKQSLLGVGWALLTPAAMTAVFTYLVTRTGINQSIIYPCPLPLYSLCLLTFWNFFQRAVTNGSTSLVTNMDLVTKVYFPREVLPISSVLTNLVDWMVAFVMFIAVAAVYTFIYPETREIFPTAYPFLPHLGWLWIPVFLFFITLFSLGLAFITSALQVYFRDVAHLINLILLLWLFVTPVLFPLAAIEGGRVSTLIILNPMTGLIDGIQRAIFSRALPWDKYIFYAAGCAVGVFLAGYSFFKHEERHFADVV